MNPNLNRQEFLQQGELFNTSSYVDIEAAKRSANEEIRARPSGRSAASDYGSAWSSERWTDESGTPPLMDNPIQDMAGAKSITRSFNENVDLIDSDIHEEFIPTLDIATPQAMVNPDAIEHQVQHSTGLDTPNIDVTAGAGPERGRFALKDGNHRLNAALQRGQMLLPANVFSGPEHGRPTPPKLRDDIG